MIQQEKLTTNQIKPRAYSFSDAELDSYRENGFLIRESVFTEDELIEFREAAERSVDVAFERSKKGRTYILDGKRFVDSDHLTVQFEHSINSDTIRVIEPVFDLDEVFNQLIDNPRIVDPMRDLVGDENVALWTAKLNLKRPQEGSGFGWHQDSPYWVHDCGHVDLLPNVLLAFDDANESNGCLKIIRGSHQQGCMTGTRDGSQLGGFFTDPDLFRESDQVALEVPAGSLVFFSQHAIHGSLPNLSDQPRRAMIMTYQPSDFPTLKTRKIRNTPG